MVGTDKLAHQPLIVQVQRHRKLQVRQVFVGSGLERGAEQKNGEVVKLEITSTFGGTGRLLSPWTTIRANGRELRLDARNIVEITTTPGARVVFTGNSLGRDK